MPMKQSNSKIINKKNEPNACHFYSSHDSSGNYIDSPVLSTCE